MKKNGAKKMNEIETKKKTELELVSQVARGFENVKREDLIIPRAKLIQGLSPERESENIKEGMIINSLTKEVLPEEFVPIFMYKNWIRFNPRSKKDPNFDSNFEPGAIIWRSDDPDDIRVQVESQFGVNGEIPLAITFMNFFCHFIGIQMPIIVSFCKSSYPSGKNLLSLGKHSGGDMFSRKYRLYSKLETKYENPCQIFLVSPMGKVDEKEYSFCENLWNEFSAKAKKIQAHDMEENDAIEKPY